MSTEDVQNITPEEIEENKTSGETLNETVQAVEENNEIQAETQEAEDKVEENPEVEAKSEVSEETSEDEIEERGNDTAEESSETPEEKKTESSLETTNEAAESDNNEEEKDAVQKEIPTIGNIANALKSDLKSQVEAVLFVTDHPMKSGEIAKVLNAPYDEIQSAIVQLMQDYEDRNGGLEIGTDNGYIIQVRVEYLNIVTDMMPLEINPGPLRTLSAIALKEPVLQSEIVDMRGSSAYDQIAELVEMDLIVKKPQGMSYILKTTQKFNQYFRLSKEASVIKDKLQKEAKRIAEERKKREEEEGLKILEGEEGNNTEANESDTKPQESTPLAASAAPTENSN